MKQISVSLVLLSLFGAANASQSADSESTCRQEMRRVAVWPHSSPKAPQFARFEYREVTVCKRSTSPSA
jgi:hypothetical protein